MPDDTSNKIDQRLVAHDGKEAIITEEYRILQTDLYALTVPRQVKTIAVTSSRMQEGKTITACNLALTLAADREKKILLIDGDLRKPDIHTMLGLPLAPGFSDAIKGACEITDVLRKLPASNLCVITAGTVVTNTTDLLRQQKVKTVIDVLKEVFDYVIIDTPPTLPVSDSRIIGSLCDGLIIVVKADVTPKDALDETIRLLEHVRIKPLAFVLTNHQIPFYEFAKRKYHEAGYKQ